MNTTPRVSQWWVNLIRGLHLEPGLIAVAESMASHADATGLYASPGRKRVSQDTGLAPTEVSKAFKALRKIRALELASNTIPMGQVGLKYRFRVPLLELDAHAMEQQFIDDTNDRSPQAKDDRDGSPKASDDPNSLGKVNPQTPDLPSGRLEVRRKKTVLYRYYDDNDVLLYIGITVSPTSRFTSHEGSSTWMDFAARSTITHFPDREKALKAERDAIIVEHPLFNLRHNDHPDRVRRMVDYLIKQNRPDLLVPQISRG